MASLIVFVWSVKPSHQKLANFTGCHSFTKSTFLSQGKTPLSHLSNFSRAKASPHPSKLAKYLTKFSYPQKCAMLEYVVLLLERNFGKLNFAFRQNFKAYPIRLVVN